MAVVSPLLKSPSLEPPAPTALQAIDVGYSINGKQILSGVNASFAPAELTAVMGASVVDLRDFE